MAKNEKAIVQVIAKENDTTAVMKEVHKASDIEENDIISIKLDIIIGYGNWLHLRNTVFDKITAYCVLCPRAQTLFAHRTICQIVVYRSPYCTAPTPILIAEYQ